MSEERGPMMQAEFVLEMRHMRKTFPGVVALDDVTFDLRRGEVHALLGENGAGKSTLVKILSGAYQKTEGLIFIEGRAVEIRNPRHAQELGIGTIYQELNLVPQLSVAENIFLGREPCRLHGLVDRTRMLEAGAEILSSLGVDMRPSALVKELGVAQQQMVEVAKALSLNARILVMDEPTSALTEKEIRELFGRIQILKRAGVSIVYISHRLEELTEIGDRVTVLRDGKHVGTHDTREITRADLIRMMVNRELTQPFPKVSAEKGNEVLRVEGLQVKGRLKDISFSLHRGEVLGIAGLLGSGRTDLARTIFGAHKPDRGRIYIDGKIGKVRSPRGAISRGIGFLTEDRKTQGLVLPLSVKDNICLSSVDRLSRFGLMKREEERRAALRHVQELKIKTPGIDRSVAYLSGGNQQKVVLSKWLCCESDILIFDEPTRGIDVGSKAEIYQLMNQLTASGVAIIMISSDLPEVLGMSDRILVMRAGEIAGEFSAQEATQEKILQCALGSE